jgi:hypothetical protein
MTRRLTFAVCIGVWAIAIGMHSGVAGGQARDVFPGDPLPGLTPREFEEFRLGLDDFTEVETSEEGLGPAFNGTSCAVCHSVPAIGGGGIMLETRAGYKDADGSFRGLNRDGDTLIHLFSVPTHNCQPTIPDDVTVIARRAPIPLFGAGLVEAIPDDTLVGLEDPLDRNRDGVSGRAALVTDVATGERRVGRFGWKAQHPTLLAFGADPTETRWGSPTICSPTNRCSTSGRRSFAFATRCRIPRTCGNDRPAAAGSTTSNRSCASLHLSHEAIPMNRRAMESGCSQRSAVRRAMFRRSPPAPARIRSSTDDRYRFFRTCCCTTSVPATGFDREQGTRGDSYAGPVGAPVATAPSPQWLGGNYRGCNRAASE